MVTSCCIRIGQVSASLTGPPGNSFIGRRLIWVAPPWVPYAPALSAAGIDLSRLLIVRAEATEEILWATEQSLRSGNCAAVLSWSASAPVAALRRLQLAASEGGTFGVIFRPADAMDNPSPAAVRMTQLPMSPPKLLAAIQTK